MDHLEFFDRVEAHPDLEGLGVEEESAEGAAAVLVRHAPSDSKYRVDLTTVARHPWEILENILTGRREPKVLSHMTRVVGYFSRTENWNRSKLGELEARHGGEYSLDTGKIAEARK